MSRLEFLRFGNVEPGEVLGQNRYDISQKESGAVAFVVVQSAHKNAQGVIGGTTLIFPLSITAGNTLIVLCTVSAGGLVTTPPLVITDNFLDVFTDDARTDHVFDVTITQTSSLLTRAVATGSGACTITVGLTGVSTYNIALAIFEVAGFTGLSGSAVRAHAACSTTNIETTTTAGSLTLSGLAFSDPGGTTETNSFTGTTLENVQFSNIIGRGSGIYAISSCANSPVDFAYVEASYK